MKIHKVGSKVWFENFQERGTKIGVIKRVKPFDGTLVTPYTVFYDIECARPFGPATVYTSVRHDKIVAPNLDIQSRYEEVLKAQPEHIVDGPLLSSLLKCKYQSPLAKDVAAEAEREKANLRGDIRNLKAALETEARRYVQLLKKHDKALAYTFKLREERKEVLSLQQKIVELQEENTKLRDEAAFQESVIKGLRNDNELMKGRLDAERKELGAQQRVFTERHATDTNEIRCLRREIKEIADKNADLRDAAITAHEEMQHLENELCDLKEELKQYKDIQIRLTPAGEMQPPYPIDLAAPGADKTVVAKITFTKDGKFNSNAASLSPLAPGFKQDSKGVYKETVIYAYRVHHLTSGQNSMEWSESETFELPGTQRSLYRLERAPEHDMISRNYIKHQEGSSK